MGANESHAECDIRVWCEECKRSDFSVDGDKYLCSGCGRIMKLDHEIHHEIFPHLCCNEDEMS